MRILSGIQPTGEYHIGNYLGAIKHWVELQEKNEAFFFIADLHALTKPQNARELRKSTLEKVMELLALGINPEKSTIFVQSNVQGILDLAWIFSTLMPVGELERMTQYKEKSKKAKLGATMGLLNYPLLQAADILIYKAEGVPVGKDQVQHLELSRVVARKFNSEYGETFKEPKAFVPELGAKILSLQNPENKMSKSDPTDSQIGILDEPEMIKIKIAKAVTDSGSAISYNPEKKPGISNLLIIYSLFNEEPVQKVAKRFAKRGYASFKKTLGELLAEKLEPFRKKYKEIAGRDIYVKEILKQGAAKANRIAAATMEEVREKIGLLYL